MVYIPKQYCIHYKPTFSYLIYMAYSYELLFQGKLNEAYTLFSEAFALLQQVSLLSLSL